MIIEEDPTCKMSHVVVASSLIVGEVHFSHHNSTGQSSLNFTCGWSQNTTGYNEPA